MNTDPETDCSKLSIRQNFPPISVIFKVTPNTLKIRSRQRQERSSFPVWS